MMNSIKMISSYYNTLQKKYNLNFWNKLLY